MTLKLNYRVNEGINVTEDLENGYRKSVDVIVRNIDLFSEGIKVDFEFRDLNGNSELKSLSEDERYDVTPLCTLHLPKDPLRGRNLSRDPLTKQREDSVFLNFYAPREVELGRRKMYEPLNL